MGRAEVECISGCSGEPSVLDGWWERHASLQVMHTIMVSEGGSRLSSAVGSGWFRVSTAHAAMLAAACSPPSWTAVGG